MFKMIYLKEVKPESSLEGLMLKLKLQYFVHLIWRADSLEKTLILGKIEDRRRRGGQRTRWFGGITDSLDMNLSKLWEMAKDREAWMLFGRILARIEWLIDIFILVSFSSFPVVEQSTISGLTCSYSQCPKRRKILWMPKESEECGDTS